MGPGGFFPTNPDLANILGDPDFDFENFHFLICLDPKFPDFQVPDFQISRNLAWARLGLGLGQAWAGLGPGSPSLSEVRDLDYEIVNHILQHTSLNGPKQTSGNLEIWNLEIWKFGIQKIKK